MNKNDISNWRKFIIGDLFDIRKGTRLTKANMKEGDHPFVGASAINNGITAMIANDEHLHEGNTITITYNGSVGEAFYQEKPFWASDDVNVLYPKFEINKYIAFFIIPVLKSKGKKYAFIDKWKKEDMERDTIMLPADKNGNPDFSSMEEYMKKLEIKVISSLYKLQSAKRLSDFSNADVTEWGYFSINSIFTVIRPAPRSQISYQVGNVPFVASGNYNNGVIKYVLPKTDEALNKGNCISISPIDGSTFYQPVDFLGRGGAGSSIILLYNEKLNKYNGLFIAATIQKVCRKYIYNDMANKGTISNEVIKLPVNKAGAPDFLYMEKYMKNLENRAKNNIEMLKKITL